MSVWIKIDSGYRNHPKTLRLRKILGPGAQWYPVALWLYCADSCISGSPGEDLIEQVCGWSGRTGRLIEALKLVGFLDADGSIHNWDQRSGGDLKIMAARKEADRKRKASADSAKVPTEFQRNSNGGPAQAPKSSAGIPTEDLRREEKSREDEMREEKTPSERDPSDLSGHPPGDPPPKKLPADEPKGLRVAGSPEARRILDHLEGQIRKHFPSIPIPEPEKRPDSHVKVAEKLKNLYRTRISRLLFAVESTFDDTKSYHRDKITNVLDLWGCHAKIIAATEFLWSPGFAVMMEAHYGNPG